VGKMMLQTKRSQVGPKILLLGTAGVVCSKVGRLSFVFLQCMPCVSPPLLLHR